MQLYHPPSCLFTSDESDSIFPLDFLSRIERLNWTLLLGSFLLVRSPSCTIHLTLLWSHLDLLTVYLPFCMPGRIHNQTKPSRCGHTSRGEISSLELVVALSHSPVSRWDTPRSRVLPAALQALPASPSPGAALPHGQESAGNWSSIRPCEAQCSPGQERLSLAVALAALLEGQCCSRCLLGTQTRLSHRDSHWIQGQR